MTWSNIGSYNPDLLTASENKVQVKNKLYLIDAYIIEIDFTNLDKPVQKEVPKSFEFDFRTNTNPTFDRVPTEHKPVNNNDLNTPAYLRHQVIFEELPKDGDVSNVFLEEEKYNKDPRFKEGGNKYLHNNVD